MQPLHLSSKSSYLFYISRSFSKIFAARLHARETQCYSASIAEKSACGGLAAKKHPALNPVYLRDTLRPLKSFSRSSSNFFCRHFFWLFFALPCRFACASGTRRQNCTRCTKEIRFPPGRSRPVFPAEDKSSVVLLPSTYLICQIKYFLDTFCENFLEIFFSIFAAQYIDFYRRYFFCILILLT